MPVRVGGDLPDPINTETEYKGTVPLPNTVQDLGPNDRRMSSSEKLRLGYLTGQEEDPYAEREPDFMAGVDSRYPETDVRDYIPLDYRSEDYLE